MDPFPGPIKPSWNLFIGDNARPGIYAAAAIGFAVLCFSDSGPVLMSEGHYLHSFRPTIFLGVYIFATGAIWYGRAMRPPRWALRIGILTILATSLLLSVVVWRYVIQRRMGDLV